jgi:mRNA interferase HigB
MHVISRRKLREFGTVHPPARTPLDAWYKKAKAATWGSFHEVQAAFPQADVYRQYVVFDIGGNKYRLIAEINSTRRKVFVRHVLTHTDYDRGNWKGQ